jgi:hypothetical protein
MYSDRVPFSSFDRLPHHLGDSVTADSLACASMFRGEQAFADLD